MAKYFEKVTPESCGVDSRDLLKMIEGMEDMPEEKETHGFMLIRHGKLLTEGWFSPYTEDMPHILFSDTKTFTQLAIGFMVREGLVTIEDKIADYFPDKLTEATSEYNKNLKIKHLLMMATGHPGNAVHARGKFSDEEYDKLREFFASETIDEPGTVFQYENIASYVLSNLVSRLTGKNIVEYLKPRFLDPLDIAVDYYSADENGVCMGYSGFRITLEALAKVGQFFLDEGVWEGKQILPKEWCRQAISKHAECIGPCGSDWNQGYAWHLWRGRYNTARLCGAYGQMCVIAPDLDLIFATNSGANYNRLQYILDNFYENVMLKIKDEPLEENQVGNIKLENKISRLKLQNAFAPLSPRVNELSGKEIKFDKILKYDSLKLDFTKQECKVTLMGDKTISFDAGLEEPKETVVDCGGFVSIDPDKSEIFSASAYFDKDDKFVITARILQTVTIVKIEIDANENVKIYTLRGRLGD
ncbi:MAG: serine hydrolase [Clostridia bacterium]|nr:serine hydrolase [Clostridia bacterium]